VITDTDDDIGIIFQLEGKDVKVSIRDFGSYVKFNKECYHKGYKNGKVNTYLTAQLFAAPAARQKVAQIEKYEHNWKIREKKVEGEQLSILSSIRNEIQ
jgi:hypothetical protein